MPIAVWAQNDWQFQSSLTATSGQYPGSVNMKSQQGWGLRLSGEKSRTLGLTVGLQSTQIAMHANLPVSQQNQEDWLLSGFMHVPSTTLPGRWTLRLDTYRTSNDALQSNSSSVRAWAPQAVWQSHSLPLKMEVGYARSKYKNMDAIDQLSTGVAWGFNEAKNWLELRAHVIQNLSLADPYTMGHSRVTGTDIKLIHLWGGLSAWTPTVVVLGLERGKKIYAIDMLTQSLYNVPALNEGGENITASWRLSEQTNFSLQFMRKRYLAAGYLPSIPPNEFRLDTLNVQIAKTW